MATYKFENTIPVKQKPPVYIYGTAILPDMDFCTIKEDYAVFTA